MCVLSVVSSLCFGLGCILLYYMLRLVDGEIAGHVTCGKPRGMVASSYVYITSATASIFHVGCKRSVCCSETSSAPT